MRGHLRQVVSPLRIRNFRLFFSGLLVSVSGNWMQEIAIAWLVLRLTNSAFALGLTTAVRTVPTLLFGYWGGLIADRLPKRKLLICTQLSQVLWPVLLWALTDTGAIRMWMVYVLVICRGAVNVLDNPVRQSFVPEMVGSDRVVSAVSLVASAQQGGRLFGPAVAAVVIATLGLAPCFLLNAFSYVFMALMVVLMRPGELTPAPVTPRGKGQLREGLSLVRRTPDLLVPLGLMTVVGLLSFNFNVALPAVARFTYHGNATTFALMMNFLAVGALVGAFFAGTRTTFSRRAVSLAALAFGVALGVTAAVHDLRLALVGLVAVGATSVAFSASVQSTLQLSVEPEMRGRILSLYQVVYQGSTPLGSIIVGALASYAGARSSLVLGSVAAIGASAVALRGGKARRIVRVDRLSASGNERVDPQAPAVQSNPPEVEPEGASP